MTIHQTIADAAAAYAGGVTIGHYRSNDDKFHAFTAGANLILPMLEAANADLATIRNYESSDLGKAHAKLKIAMDALENIIDDSDIRFTTYCETIDHAKEIAREAIEAMK